MFTSIIGQQSLKQQLERAANAAKIRKTYFPHFCLSSGTGGTGKTMFINEIAKTLSVNIQTLGAVDTTPVDVANAMGMLPNNSIIFLEEWNATNSKLDFFLRPFLENRLVCVNGVTYPSSYDYTIAIATNNISCLSQPLKSRLRAFQMEDYTQDELILITQMHSEILKLQLHSEIIHEVANRSRGVPRNIVQILKSLLDEYTISNYVSKEKAISIMEELGIYEGGFDRLDLKIMSLLHQTNELSLSALCGATGESPETIRNHEAFLITQGMLTIKARRQLTNKGLEKMSLIDRNSSL